MYTVYIFQYPVLFHLAMDAFTTKMDDVVNNVLFFQEYTMLCLLCGKAEDSISVLPDDPRQSAPLF